MTTPPVIGANIQASDDDPDETSPSSPPADPLTCTFAPVIAAAIPPEQRLRCPNNTRRRCAPVRRTRHRFCADPPARRRHVVASRVSIACGVTRAGRLRVVLALNLLLVGGLVAIGLSAHSLGVLAEGVDYLADAAAIAVSLLAIRLSNRSPTAKQPHGYPKATALAAALNAGWLLVLSLLVVVGAADRLRSGTHPVHGLPVLIISGIAAAVMVGGVLIAA